MKKLFTLIMSVVSAIAVLCTSASAATIGDLTADAENLAVATGDERTILIIVAAVVAVAALAVIIISIVSKKKKNK